MTEGFLGGLLDLVGNVFQDGVGLVGGVAHRGQRTGGSGARPDHLGPGFASRGESLVRQRAVSVTGSCAQIDIRGAGIWRLRGTRQRLTDVVKAGVAAIVG
jgi:hypothetical protein